MIESIFLYTHSSINSGRKDLDYLLKRSQVPNYIEAQTIEEAIALGIKKSLNWVLIHGVCTYTFQLSKLNEELSKIIAEEDFCFIGAEEDFAGLILVSIEKYINRGCPPIEAFFADNDIKSNKTLSKRLMDETQTFVFNESELVELSGYIFSNKGDDSIEEEGRVKNFLRIISKELSYAENNIFLVNNESFNDKINAEKYLVEQLLVPASGLIPFALFSQLNSNKLKKVVFYDISMPALTYMKRFIDSWNGENFVEFLNQVLSDPNFEFLQNVKNSPDLNNRIIDSDGPFESAEARLNFKFTKLIHFCGGKEKFNTLIKELRKKELEFVPIDLINEYKNLNLQGANSFIWISNIYSYRPTFFKNAGTLGLEKKFNDFIEFCSQGGKEIYLYGDIPKGKNLWLTSVKKLLEI
jgi:hypothetical protein